MTETLTGAPADLPVTIAQARESARISADDADAHVQDLIIAAVAVVEQSTNRSLYTQTWTKHLDDFPRSGDRVIRLNRKPVASITSITYLSSTGVSTTLGTSVYRTDTAAGKISEAYDQTWPETRDVIDAVQVAYVSGSTSLDEIPAPLRRAVLMLVGELYNKRELSIAGIVSELPLGPRALLAPYMNHAL